MPSIRSSRAVGKSNVWRAPAFVRLWVGQTVSLFGSEITAIALPLTAALALGATPPQMGLLIAAEALPYALIGLVAGVWVDRVRRRPLLLVADLLRALLLGSIVLAALLNAISLLHLYLVAFSTGTLTVLFGAASQSYLPTLIPREDLVSSNSTLEASRAVAQIAGPSLGGPLAALLTPPLAIGLDALSFLVSALCIWSIRVPEPAPIPPADSVKRSMLSEIAVGLRAIWASALLRDTTISSTLYNLATGVMGAVYILFATRELGLGAVLLGLVFASGNVGVLAGALLTTRLARRFGVGPSVVWTALLEGLGAFLVPLATCARHDGPNFAAVVLLLVIARLLTGLSDTIFVVNVVSLRQAITPIYLQGRVNAGVRSIADGIIPLGAVVGGLLGQSLGLQLTLVVGAALGLVSVLWLWRSPLRQVRELPMAAA